MYNKNNNRLLEDVSSHFLSNNPVAEKVTDNSVNGERKLISIPCEKKNQKTEETLSS